jgi:DNA-3-methyladenine glycosylase
MPLDRAMMPSETMALARFLLGRRVVRVLPEGILAGRIVETEAYPPGDPAAHHYRRMTQRNRSLFLDLGFAYVYRAYGACWMLNVASETAGLGAGVLIRALAPEQGTALMARHRGNVPARDLARGPGRLAAALAVDRSLDGVDLCAPGPLYLAAGDREVGEIGVSVRIGITRAADRPWRFFVRGSRFVSGPAWLNRGEPPPAGTTRAAL